MDDKKFESPEEVREFLDSDAFADGFKKWLVTSGIAKAISQHLEPLVKRWLHLMETAAPILLKVTSEFAKWNFSSEVLGKAGWLPHYTMPFDHIAECGKDNDAIRSRLLDYYKNNWKNVRSEIEARLSDYKIDAEAKATFREALDAHEAGLYRCVCRVLFPEIERVLRQELFDDEIRREPITYEEFIRKLIGDKKPIDGKKKSPRRRIPTVRKPVDDNKSIDAFIHEGLYDLSIFGHLTKAVREKDRIERREKPVSESDKLIFGLFTGVKSEEHREILNKNPIPNRHAAIHGLVVYSSLQSSLNAIFIADYIFRIAATAMPRA